MSRAPERKMEISLPGYAALGASVIGLVLIHYACVRLLSEWLRPASAYLFLAGRLGAVIAFLCWIAFFNLYWYPQYVGQAIPSTVNAAEIAVLGFLLLIGFATLPRAPRKRTDGNA